MSGKSWTRALLSLLAACGLTLGVVDRAPQTATVEAAAPALRATVRVGMWTLWRDREVVLTLPDHAARSAMRLCEQCKARTLASRMLIRAEGDALTISSGRILLRSSGLWLSGVVTLAAHGETVTLRSPVVITARASKLIVVVSLPVESYVERVVASESGPDDSMESLKALAIVVRTFALHEAHGHADYDLCDSTHCQLLHWGGNPMRQAAAHAAALATADETLWFHRQRALGYFSKDCGGRTASPQEVWPKARPAPYLQSLSDRYCTARGGREWSSEIARTELTTALASHGLVRAGWQNLTVARRGESGRAMTLRLDETEIAAEEFRIAVGETLGWNRIPSTWFEVSRQGDLFEFHGRGWGHGVGLCQTGAAVMASQGRTERDILAQYFPGAEAADEASGRVWQSLAGSGFTLESLRGDDAAFLPELARARAEAAERSGLNMEQPITVRAFASTPEFREATLAPGWVAAFTEGNWIGTQPLRTLATRKLLADTMRHEFLHALVEHEAGPAAPLWLREGVVEVWSERHSAPAMKSSPRLTIGQVDSALARAGSEAESEAAHRAAAWYAAQLLARYGRAQVLDWLRSGLPAAAIAQR
jgi:stage II sporulation protein D